MTGYNIAHGDTNAVYLNLANSMELDGKMKEIVSSAFYENGEWYAVDTAADKLKAYVQELQALGTALDKPGNLGEIVDADLNAVDWIGLVLRELIQINLDEDRDDEAGMRRWQR